MIKSVLKGVFFKYKYFLKDIYCELKVLQDETIYKTDVLKGTNVGDFKFTKQFTFLMTQQVNKLFLKNVITPENM